MRKIGDVAAEYMAKLQERVGLLPRTTKTYECEACEDVQFVEVDCTIKGIRTKALKRCVCLERKRLAYLESKGRCNDVTRKTIPPEAFSLLPFEPVTM